MSAVVPRFQPEEILRALEKYGVRYVLIGGLAATLHGAPLRTGVADICPARDPGDLERLANALRSIDARVRAADVPPGLSFVCDAEFLRRVELLNLATKFGELDIAFQPAGTRGYMELIERVQRYDLGGLVVPVAALEDVIRSKEAAGRAKDQEALPTLRTLLAMKRAREEGS